MKILILTSRSRVERFTDFNKLPKNWEYVYAKYTDPVEDILRIGGDADGILVDAIGTVSAELIAGMPNLKMIHSEGVGYEGVDVAAARAAGIDVCNNRGANRTAVAEQAVFLMLAVMRRAIVGHRMTLEGRQIEAKVSWSMEGIYELGSRKVGLIGMGDIGKATAKILHAFGCDVVYYNRHRLSEEAEKEYKVTYLPLDDLLMEADIVSIHIASTPETKDFMNAEKFAKMKKGSILINTARGEVVNNEDLLSALESGILGGAGLDTIAPEPVLKDNPVVNAKPEILDKLVISPHIGGLTVQTFEKIYNTIWSNFKKVEDGEKPCNIVNV